MIIIYTSSKCPHCKKVKEYLVENDINHQERNVGDADYRRELFEYGVMSVPLLVNTKTGNTVNGFVEAEIEETIKGA